MPRSVSVKSLTLDRLLQSQGFGTRKWCQQIITRGELAVDGTVVRDPRISVRADQHRFTVFGEAMEFRVHVYLALNKPPGFECSRKASHHPGILTLLPEQMRWRDVQPVGRLDHDTTGLLLLSDDGDFIHRQASPRHKVRKVYCATVQDTVDAALVERLRSGVQLHDEPAPIAAERCHATGPRQLELVLAEGKYHQVKRMLAAAGNHCTGLQRIAIGELRLDALGLAEGQWCHLDDTGLALLGATGQDGLQAAPPGQPDPASPEGAAHPTAIQAGTP